jgi:cysteine desulfurase
MAANNEIGTLQPVAELGTICAEREIIFHTDAVQYLGKEPFDNIHQFHADLVSICAHKIHGPKGAGALFIKSPLHPEPLILGGSHEHARRAGTENLAGIMGLVEVLERFVRKPVFDRELLGPLTTKLVSLIERLPDTQFVGDRQHRLCNTVSFVTKRADSIALLASLDLEGICASSGSACSAGSLEPSHVVRALGLVNSLANSLVRFSLGRESTVDEVELVGKILPPVIARAQHGQ